MGGGPSSAVAALATAGGSQLGFATFRATSKGVLVAVDVAGLPPNSSHGLHVHELGDLRDGFASLGAHYDPGQRKTHGGAHGLARHAGDFGSLQTDGAGAASLRALYPELRLGDLLGRSVVLHAGADDLGRGRGPQRAESLKTGNSGARLAAGVIGLAAPA